MKQRWDPRFTLETLELPAELRAELKAWADARARAAARRAKRAYAKQNAEYDAKAAARREQAAAPSWPDFSTPPAGGVYIRAWDPVQVQHLEASAPSRFVDRDELARVKKVVAQMREAGPWRRAVGLPGDWRTRVNDLAERFPNFASAGVLDFVASGCAFAERRDSVLGWGHTLLSGPPGIGKSLFCDALARAFALPMYRIDMAAAETGGRLAGSDEVWSNSKPGLLFSVLGLATGDASVSSVSTPAFNALLLLDELEKVGEVGRRQYDPTGSLYTLLEPATSRTFADRSLPAIQLDASRLIVTATANMPERIAPPILSRLRHFRIPAPSPTQTRTIIERVHAEIAGELAIASEPLPPAVMERLATCAPRAIRQQLQEAFGRALVSGRTVLEASDFPAPTIVLPPAVPRQVIVVVAHAELDSVTGDDVDEPPRRVH